MAGLTCPERLLGERKISDVFHHGEVESRLPIRVSEYRDRQPDRYCLAIFADVPLDKLVTDSLSRHRSRKQSEIGLDVVRMGNICKSEAAKLLLGVAHHLLMRVVRDDHIPIYI